VSHPVEDIGSEYVILQSSILLFTYQSFSL